MIELYHNIFKFGYPFYQDRNRGDESDGLRTEFSQIKSVLIEGMHIEEKSANEIKLPIIHITNPIDEIIIRDCEFIRHKDSDKGDCFIELDKEAKIQILSFNNINLYNVEKDIDVKNGEIINKNLSGINSLR